MHYYEAEADMKAIHGLDIILVREPEKIDHYTQTLGEPIDSVWAHSSIVPNGARYEVFRIQRITLFRLFVKLGIYRPLQ